MKFLLRINGEGKEDEYEKGVELSRKEENEENDEWIPATVGNRFFYEADLENFIIENLDNLDLGGRLRIYSDDRGYGQQYPTGSGEIDILAVDSEDNFVVIELKRGRARHDSVGQLAKYLQWVDENLAKNQGKNVRGIIIAYRGKDAIRNAARALRFPVIIKQYKINLDLTEI